MSAGPIEKVAYGQDWTVADLDRIPEDDYRYELFDGVPSVLPFASLLHQRVTARLEQRLAAAQPPSHLALRAIGIELAQDQWLIPDLVVLRRPIDFAASRYSAANVELAVEVVAPSTRSSDRFRKPMHYGLARIPSYWRVELDPIQVIAYRLSSQGEYVEAAQAGAGQRFVAVEPFPVEFDPAELLP